MSPLVILTPTGQFFFVVLVNNNNTVAHVWVIKCSLLHPGVAPFSGATTGTGGRIRDVQSAGKGGHVIAGTAGYCFGNLHIPGKLLIHLFCFKNEPLPLSWIVPFKLSSPFFFFHILFCEHTSTYQDLLSSQVLCSRGRRKGGSTHPALLLHSKWP